MTSESCGHRKHTPLVSDKQRRLFGMWASGKKKPKSISYAEIASHLKESKGKKLPTRSK